MKRLMFALFFLVTAEAAAAVDGANVSAPWLNLAVEGRGAGMAGALTAVDADLASVRANVAGLGRLRRPTVSLGYLRHIEDSSLQSAMVGLPLATGVMAVGVDYFSFGVVEKVEVNGPSGFAVTTGTLQPYGSRLSLAYAQSLGSVGLGATLHGLAEQLEGPATFGAAVDVGALWHSPLKGLDAGLSVANLGTGFYGYALPVELRSGLAWRPAALARALFSGELRAPLVDTMAYQAALGAEYEVHPLLTARLGGRLGQAFTATGFTAGASFRYEPLTLDYAFQGLGNLGSSHLVSLSMSLGRPGEGKAEAAPTPVRTPEPMSSRDLVMTAIEALEKDNVGAASEAIDKLTRRDPAAAKTALALVREAMLRQSLVDDDLNRAERSLGLMVRIDPGYAQGHEALGIVLFHLGRDSEARRSLRQALLLDPNSKKARLLLDVLEKGYQE